MYGTLAFMRSLPGRRPELVEYMGRFRIAGVGLASGLIVTYVYALDRDPDEAVLLAVFDDREAYERNAASPEQHERYMGYRSLLETDPEWHDGDITPYLAFAERQHERGMYGTVGRWTTRPGAEPAVMQWLDDADNTSVAGALGLWSLAPDNERNVIYLAAVFESKRAYWTNAESPEQDEFYRRLRQHLTADPEWYDGEIAAYPRL